MVAVYGLFDQGGALRYIGKANDPASRLKSHMRDAKRRDTLRRLAVLRPDTFGEYAGIQDRVEA